MKTALLLLYVSVLFEKFYLKILLRYGQRQFGKKKNNEKAAIKLAHTRASQTLEIVAAS